MTIKQLSILTLIPPIIIFDLYMVSFIGDLVSAKSDISVLVGILSFALLPTLNYLLTKKLYNQFKTEKK